MPPLRNVSWFEKPPHNVVNFLGGATNSHSGNRSFRTLVKRYQDQYLHAKKREKPAVASTSKTP